MQQHKCEQKQIYREAQQEDCLQEESQLGGFQQEGVLQVGFRQEGVLQVALLQEGIQRGECQQGAILWPLKNWEKCLGKGLQASIRKALQCISLLL